MKSSCDLLPWFVPRCMGYGVSALLLPPAASWGLGHVAELPAPDPRCRSLPLHPGECWYQRESAHRPGGSGGGAQALGPSRARRWGLGSWASLGIRPRHLSPQGLDLVDPAGAASTRSQDRWFTLVPLAAPTPGPHVAIAPLCRGWGGCTPCAVVSPPTPGHSPAPTAAPVRPQPEEAKWGWPGALPVRLETAAGDSGLPPGCVAQPSL